jgi:hypothetical protein
MGSNKLTSHVSPSSLEEERVKGNEDYYSGRKWVPASHFYTSKEQSLPNVDPKPSLSQA